MVFLLNELVIYRYKEGSGNSGLVFVILVGLSAIINITVAKQLNENTTLVISKWTRI